MRVHVGWANNIRGVRKVRLVFFLEAAGIFDKIRAKSFFFPLKTTFNSLNVGRNALTHSRTYPPTDVFLVVCRKWRPQKWAWFAATALLHAQPIPAFRSIANLELVLNKPRKSPPQPHHHGHTKVVEKTVDNVLTAKRRIKKINWDKQQLQPQRGSRTKRIDQGYPKETRHKVMYPPKECVCESISTSVEKTFFCFRSLNFGRCDNYNEQISS
jgi:hypothetical protein